MPKEGFKSQQQHRIPARSCSASLQTHPQHPAGGEEELGSFSFHAPLFPVIPSYPVPCYPILCRGHVNSMLLDPALLLHPHLAAFEPPTKHNTRTTDPGPPLAQSQSPRGPISSCFASLAQPARGNQTIRDSLMTLRTAPVNEGGTNPPAVLGWAGSPWFWLHPPPSRLDSEPGGSRTSV